MEKNIEQNNYIKYYDYVKENMIAINSSGSKFALSKIYEEIDPSNLDIKCVRRLCELVEFVRISENVKKFALYHEWYRHFR